MRWQLSCIEGLNWLMSIHSRRQDNPRSIYGVLKRADPPQEGLDLGFGDRSGRDQVQCLSQPHERMLLPSSLVVVADDTWSSIAVTAIAFVLSLSDNALVLVSHRCSKAPHAECSPSYGALDSPRKRSRLATAACQSFCEHSGSLVHGTLFIASSLPSL
jgi:hypothetical protein